MEFKHWLFAESSPSTPGAQVQMGYGGISEGFAIITQDGAKAIGYAYNADFPGDSSSKDRGELFYVEVPKHLRRKGLGLSLARDALQLIKSHGCNTINMSPTTEEGAGLITKLLSEGDIIGPIRTSTTGKSEYKLP